MPKLKKLALGTVQFGMAYGVANKEGAVPLEEARAILDQARIMGIDTLDTAVGYGQSEALLGQLDVKSFRIISKLPGLPDDVANVDQWVQSHLRGSLERLRVARLEGLLLHRPSDLLGGQGLELYTALCRMQEAGLVEKIGVSVYGPTELDALFAHYDFNLVQAPMNILDTRLLESGWSDRLAARDIELHTRSAFLQGLLLMPASERPARFGRFAAVWQCWDDWLQATGLSPLQACLRFAQSVPSVAKVVVGVDSSCHLQAIAAAMDDALPSLPAWPLIESQLINPSAWNNL